MTGMLAALGASDEGGDLFMFTDASSKDGGLAGAVSSLATSKEIRVFPIAFGSCSPLDPAYIRIANDSGGQVFMLFASEAGNITRLADFIVRSNAVNLLSIGDTLAGTAKTYAVPVDPTMTRLTFSVSGATSVAVFRPDGTTVQPTDPGVSFVSLTSGRIFSIADPASGTWSVTINGSGVFSLGVTGESTLDLSSFRFVELRGRPGHQGFLPITGFPLAGQASMVDAVMTEGFSTTQFELRTKAGAPLQTVNLSPVPDTTDEFAGTVTPPNTPFLIYVTGLDTTGAAYQRVLASIITPQTVKIVAPTSQDLRPGQTTTYVFKVTNLGPADTFNFTGSDDQGFLISISPANFALNTNQTIDVTVQLRPPITAAPGTTDTLTAVVQSTGASGANNFAVVTSSVASANSPPDCSTAVGVNVALWPPNHNMVSIDVLAATKITDPDGDPVTISINSITQDEPVTGSGKGAGTFAPTGSGGDCFTNEPEMADTAPDGTGVGTAVASIRAERDGNGNGRVYQITFTASDNKGGSCQGVLLVSVPHCQNGTPAVDDGQEFDSTQGLKAGSHNKRRSFARVAPALVVRGEGILTIGVSGTRDRQ